MRRKYHKTSVHIEIGIKSQEKGKWIFVSTFKIHDMTGPDLIQ